MDPPSGLIGVPVPKAVLLLTEAEYVRGSRRGKWWKQIQAEAKREADAVTPHAPRAPEGGTDALAAPALLGRVSESRRRSQG